MQFLRKLLCVCLCCMLLGLIPQAQAAEMDIDDYAQLMIQYYLAYQDAAEAEIEILMNNINDPWLENMWREIIDSWAYNDYHMPVYQDVLPDGLPQDDSLCIVIMGFGLNPDGSMKEELYDRLSVGLASAMKYPNAYVAVTGGATSSVKGITEAGQMAGWLRNQGISDDRLIVESRALSTTENAINVHKMLMDSYPTVNSLAVVTSDYHIRQSCTMFTTVSHNAVCTSGVRALELVGNAVNYTGRYTDTRYTEAWGISLITGTPFDRTPDVPMLFVNN